MPELVLFHGIFFLRLCLRAPSLNNAVYVISVSQALITTAQRPPEAEDRLCWFYRFFRVGFRFRFFSFRNCLTPNACSFYYRSDLDCYKYPTESDCGGIQSRSQYSSHNIAPEPSGKSIGNEIRPLPRNNELHL